MKSAPPVAIVVSYYDIRPVENLYRLMRQIVDDISSKDQDFFVVVNSEIGRLIDLSFLPKPVSILYRPNMGMNIGAWDHGWRAAFNHQYFVFLQDECQIVRASWLEPYRTRLQDQTIGLLGESIDHDASWEKCFQQRKPKWSGRMRQLYDDVKRFGIDPGLEARHLRSLVWATRRDVLNQMGGFPIGLKKRQCIAAECAVSRKVVSMGLKVELVGKTPFALVSHPQWDPLFQPVAPAGSISAHAETRP